MKFAYSTLATFALLFSMPALASNFADKGTNKGNDKAAPKESKQIPRGDKIILEIERPQGKSPICYTGG